MVMKGLVNATPFGGGLLRCGSVEEFRAASPLPPDSQRLIDKAVISVGLERLVLVQDLLSEGLTFPLDNWLAVPEIYQERIGRAGHAQRSMIPKSRGERQVMQRDGYTVPVYCTWDDFSFGIRELLASERVGTPLDTSHTQGATRNVNEAIEDAAWNGAGFNVRGNTAYGVLNAPNANTQEYVDNEAWTASGHSGEDILTDFMNILEMADDAGYPGPYNFYMPTSYMMKLGQDYKSATSGTILERLRAVEVGGRPVNFRSSRELTGDRTALIQMTSDVIDVIVGQQPTTVSWEDGPGWERYFVVLACLITRVKYNIEGGSGIVLGGTTF